MKQLITLLKGIERELYAIIRLISPLTGEVD